MGRHGERMVNAARDPAVVLALRYRDLGAPAGALTGAATGHTLLPQHSQFN